MAASREIDHKKTRPNLSGTNDCLRQSAPQRSNVPDALEIRNVFCCQMAVLDNSGNQTALLNVVTPAIRHISVTTLTTIAGSISLPIDGGDFSPPWQLRLREELARGGSPGIVFCSSCLHSGLLAKQLHRRRNSPAVSQQPSRVEHLAPVHPVNESNR